MRTLIEIKLADDTATRKLGAWLAPVLGAGDVIALKGDLGAGKTTLARGLIQALLGTKETVPSPTFTLVQAYGVPGSNLTIWHFDLYRLSHLDELVELGWEDALADGIALVEWPERAGEVLPESALWLELTEHASGRRARLIGNSDWQKRLDKWAG